MGGSSDLCPPHEGSAGRRRKWRVFVCGGPVGFALFHGWGILNRPASPREQQEVGETVETNAERWAGGNRKAIGVIVFGRFFSFQNQRIGRDDGRLRGK